MRPYYQDDLVTLYHGDCREVLPLLSSFALLLTDPPYGLREARGKNKSRSNLATAVDYGMSDWDDAPPARWLLDQARSMCRWQIIFGGNFFELPPSPCWLVWDKDNSGDFADCELAWTNLDQAVRKIIYRWNGMLQEPGVAKEIRAHPTQKPQAVMRWALSQAPSDAMTVLDPFAGSGTTLVEAKRLGKSATGIERDEKYCDIAANRLRQGSLAEMFSPMSVA